MERTSLSRTNATRPFASGAPRLLAALILTLTMIHAPFTRAQDGAVDPGFNAADIGFGNGDGTNGAVLAAALRSDGRVIIGGGFTQCHGQPRVRITQLNVDGSLDNSFSSTINASDNVSAIAVQSNGKILLGGEFQSIDGNTSMRLARLNSNGTFDPTFNTGGGFDGAVYAIRIQSDGKILVGGGFHHYDGVTRNGIARLLANGDLDTSFDPGLGPDAAVRAIIQQSDGKIIVGGAFSTWNGATRIGVARIYSDGSLETAYNQTSGTMGAVFAMALQTDGKLVVGGTFTLWGGATRPRIARLTTSGTLDATFVPGSGANGQVNALVLLTSGKILVGGAFSTYNGSSASGIVRVNSDGSKDDAFDTGTGASPSVSAIAVRSDGKAVIGGSFSSYNGIARQNLAQVNTTGGLDATFANNTGANATVFDVVVQSDGKVLIAGAFTLVNGVTRSHIARLNADGTLDATFFIPQGVNGTVNDIALQPDGKILIAGEFTMVNGTSRGRVARLNSNGSLDNTFDPGTGANTDIYRMALQTDGKVLIAGGFTTFNGVTRSRIARLNTNGSLDNTFSPGTGFDNAVMDLVVRPDGKIITGGMFLNVNGTMRSRIARLNANGSLDNAFNAGVNGTVRSLAIQADGKVLLGGAFTLVNGVPVGGYARLGADGTVDASFNAGTSPATILRILPLADGRVFLAGSFVDFNGTTQDDLVRILANGTADAGFHTGAINLPVWAMAPLSNGDLIIGGDFLNIGATGRNRFARLDTYGGVRARVMLQGPYTGTTMNDGLRTLPSFPLIAPFASMGYAEANYLPASTTASVLSVTGNNAVVDWVLVEMRPAASPGTVATSRAALLQRDGDVVASDGVSPLSFPDLAPGNYCLAVKPRNHLPVMQSVASPLSYGAASSLVDLTLVGTPVHGGDPRIASGNVMLLRAGDVTFNEVVKYTGAGNDRDPILVRVGGSNPNTTISGYFLEDANMDGTVKYTGNGNDRDLILTTVGSTTPSGTKSAQLP